jgi:hypothetical protein
MISIILAIIVVGVLLWVVQLLPMEPRIRQILYVVVVICLLLWLLQAFGLMSGVRIR